MGLGISWPLSYTVPLLAAAVLVPGGKSLTPKGAIAFVAVVAGASAFGLVVSAVLLPYSGAFLLMMAWLLMAVFYGSTGDRSPLVTMWLLIALTVIPLVSLQSGFLALVIAQSLVISTAVAMLCVWFAAALFPWPAATASAEQLAAQQPALPPGPDARVVSALKSTAVVYPMLLVFLFFNLAESALILIFVALLAQNPSLGAGKTAGTAMIAANTAGGLLAILIYNLLIAVPTFYYLLVLVLLAGLLFGQLITSNWKYAKLGGMAFSTVLLIIGSTTTSTTDAGSKVLTRVLQIVAAVVYLVIAFGLIEKFAHGRRLRNA